MNVEVEPILKPLGAPVYFMTPFGEKVTGKFFGFRRMVVEGQSDNLGVAIVKKDDSVGLYSLSSCREVDNGSPTAAFYPFHMSFDNSDGSNQIYRFAGHVENLESSDEGMYVAMQTIDLRTGNGITSLFTIDQILARQEELYDDLYMRRPELDIW